MAGFNLTPKAQSLFECVPKISVVNLAPLQDCLLEPVQGGDVHNRKRAQNLVLLNVPYNSALSHFVLC